jgi:hypothetical protein
MNNGDSGPFRMVRMYSPRTLVNRKCDPGRPVVLFLEQVRRRFARLLLLSIGPEWHEGSMC